MEYRQFENRFVIRLENGEEIVSSIREFCSDRQIRAGMIFGIGALSEARISYFDPVAGEYLHRDLIGDREMTSLTGNISTTGEEIILHLHVTLADRDYNVTGGHLTSGLIGATGEIFVDKIEGKLERKPVNESGLKLLTLSNKERGN
jgi:uncharacterized protein